MERYDSYKESGIKWVGEIPGHWGSVKPWTVLNPVKRDVQEDDEIVTCFRDGVVTLRKHRREEGFTNSLKEIGYQRVLRGDLVVHEMDGFAGSIGVSDSDGKSTPVYTVIPTTSGQSNRYWMYLLREMSRSGFIESLSRSIRERTTEFRWKTWKDQEFPLPSFNEQEQIVEYLDRKTTLIDSLIEKTEKRIELLKEKRTSLINQVVTKGLNPDVEMKDSGVEWIGEIPSHWVKKKLGYLVNIQGRVGFKGYKKTDLVDEGEGSLVLGGKHINTQQRIDLSDPDYLSWEKYYESPEIMVRQGDMIVSQRGTLGKVVVVDKDFGPMTINPSLVVLNQVQESVKYLWYFIQSEVIQEVIVREGSVTTIPMLSQEEISSFPILVPTQEEQEQIVEYLDQQTSTIDSTITTEEKRIELLKEYRQSLISEVVTGKVKV